MIKASAQQKKRTSLLVPSQKQASLLGTIDSGQCPHVRSHTKMSQRQTDPATLNPDLDSVSVIIPNFNSGHMLTTSVVSVLQQEGSFRLNEIIVVDDHSTNPDEDDYLAAIATNNRVRVVKNSRSKGPGGARNSGAAIASGRWLAFLDADDIYLPDSLNCRVSAARQFPLSGVVTGDFQLQDTRTGIIEEPFFKTRERPAALFRTAYESAAPAVLPLPYRQALETAFCHSCSVLVDKNLFWSVGGYEESLRYMEDHHLWYKLARSSDFVLVPKSVFHYRIHDSNMTHRLATPFEYRKKMLDVVRAEGHPAELADAISSSYATGHFQDFRWHLARRAIGRAALSLAQATAYRLGVLR